jgi:crotonobetainyl-CoA:carnitine CoA-transferase CaiB-like acyl-CoA transferase
MFNHFRHVFKAKTLAEWVQILIEHDIEFGPVNSTVEHLWQDPHMQARQMLFETTDPSTGQKQYEPGFSMKFAGTPAEKRRGATPMGSDTEDVLTELGYTTEQQASLRDNGVIA